MPYSDKTKLIIRREKIRSDIRELRRQLRNKEEYLEELEEILRLKGPYKRQLKGDFDAEFA